MSKLYWQVNYNHQGWMCQGWECYQNNLLELSLGLAIRIFKHGIIIRLSCYLIIWKQTNTQTNLYFFFQQVLNMVV